MADLLTLQRAFAASLDSTRRGNASGLRGDADSVTRGLDIYRANVAASALKAMSVTYPVIRQVVGAGLFEDIVQAHRQACPSTSGDLFNHGADLAGFLAGFGPVRRLPYLPALASLEWFVHVAETAADAAPLDAAALAAAAPERQFAIRFDLAPGTALLDADYPLARIWNLHQPGHEGGFEVDWSVRERVLVARNGWQVTVADIGAGEAAFITALSGGMTLGEAADRALEADADFDLAAWLGRAIASRLVCGFRIEE